MAYELHRGSGTEGEVRKSSHDVVVVDMERDMLASKILTPAEDCVDDGKELLELDVTFHVALWESRRKPVGVEHPTNALGTAGVGVEIDVSAVGRNEMDAVPGRCKCGPPGNVAACGAGDASLRMATRKCAQNRRERGGMRGSWE